MEFARDRLEIREGFADRSVVHRLGLREVCKSLPLLDHFRHPLAVTHAVVFIGLVLELVEVLADSFSVAALLLLLVSHHHLVNRRRSVALSVLGLLQ